MNTHADKMQESKRQSVANDFSQNRSTGKGYFQFVDNRPEAIAQRKMQEIANNSQKTSNFRSFPRNENHIVQRELDPETDTVDSNPDVYNKIINSHIDMIGILRRKFDNNTLYVGIGGSPELLIRSMKEIGVTPTPVIIPATSLPSIETLKETALDMDLEENTYLDRVSNYFNQFIKNKGSTASTIVVLDYVSSGTSLRSALGIIQGLFPEKQVLGQPIAMKGEAVADEFLSPLIADAELIGLLNTDGVKKLTRTVPSVPIDIDSLSEDGRLMNKAFEANPKMKIEPNFKDKKRNRNEVVEEVSKRAKHLSTNRELLPERHESYK
ncbi:hypothetical protein [Celerinatantimonas yamalensis]|uniref:Phosphoribosyltransferase domain-containing protein n=1 Tax=Celerinatantimonas yamalensis TaxID=559956 RepID=A0ABW9G6I1_9GAMM